MRNSVFHLARIAALVMFSAGAAANDCSYAADEADSNADALIWAAERVIRCAKQRDTDANCQREAREVRSAQSDYESSLDQVEEECQSNE